MSGTVRVTAQAVITGPIGSGAASRACEEWAEKTSQALGDEAVRLLRGTRMDKSGRATGAFGELLRAERRSPTQVRVAGPRVKGVAWSPWLEGTSERNQKTRFKGYRLFRKAQAELEQRAPEIGQKVLDGLMPEIGGE